MSETAAGAQSRRRAPGELTPRQREVLDLLAKRHTNGEIAEKLGISLSAAKWHVSEIISTLGVDTREEAADWWREQNGLRTRLRRTAFSGLGLLSYRPLMIAAAATSVALLAAVAIFAMTNNGDEPAPPSVGSTPTSEVSPTGTPNTPMATPSSSPDPLGNYTTYPLPSRDDLFVYTVATGQSASGSRLFPERSVVVQDLGTGEIVLTSPTAEKTVTSNSFLLAWPLPDARSSLPRSLP
jgi:DNA-binding CsgD family transcriptional regulator